jgi:hypothetical protein
LELGNGEWKQSIEIDQWNGKCYASFLDSLLWDLEAIAQMLLGLIENLDAKVALGETEILLDLALREVELLNEVCKGNVAAQEVAGLAGDGQIAAAELSALALWQDMIQGDAVFL